MRRCGLLLVAMALIALAFAGTVTRASALAALLGISSDSAGWSSGLIVKIKKKKNCTVVFVCDFFNPATSCANPPCCKKGHTEKECQPAGGPTTTPAPAPEPASGQCNLCTNKGDCSPAGPPAECADRKAAAEKLNVTPFLKWSCICK